MINPSSTRKIAIVGAGAAGIICAKTLKAYGLDPVIFEKSRGLGGRLATRRMDGGIAFDHGAQYVTMRTTSFKQVIHAAAEADAAKSWQPKFHSKTLVSDQDWFVGTPTMNAFIKPLAEGIDIRLTTEVKAIARDADAWRVKTDNSGDGERFDMVVSTAPAPQARAFLASEPVVGEMLGEVVIAPCWALMVAFASRLDPGFDAWRSSEGDLAWIARNSSKPGRGGHKECWIAHASPEWSANHLELDRDEVRSMLIDRLASSIGGELPDIEHSAAHRWRYAQTTKPLGKPYISSDDRTLFVGGDWCLGARVECAHESGLALAGALTDALADHGGG